ncbi:MAG: type II secretion system protein GspE [Planctomycetota bacterium]|nr:MAG: type II secretion system protein GspE [Planctomycetota bacterium]
MKRAPLGAILQQMGVVTFEQVEEALEFQKRERCKIGEALIRLGYATSEHVAQALAKQFHMPYIDLNSIDIPEDVINAVPAEVAIEHKIVPIQGRQRVVTIAMSDPLDFETVDNVRFILNKEVETVLATPEAIEDALRRYYGYSGDDLTKVVEEKGEELDDVALRREEAEAIVEEGADADDAPVIRLVSTIIAEAVKQRASDIHIEPFEKRLRIRYRIDGICVEQESPPKRLQGAIVSRIKIMAKLDMAEKRRPQDGAIQLKMFGRELDLRVSIVPSTWGESVVIRILDRERGLMPLEKLGLHEDDFKRFKKIIKRPNGIFLVTGPTGSGKTTTLYAVLMELNRSDVKIITAEDPIEYHIPGINQCQVNRKVGMTFARIIRAMLRQAPNIILVGEIRDKETADVAIQAALTGHLVFSTLHTNDAPSALPRLIDLGVKPFLAASGVIGVMAQRLVRVLCPHCKEPYEPSEYELRAIGISRSEAQEFTFYRPVGCPECGYRGYRGRLGIFELMEMNSVLRQMTFEKRSAHELREQARKSGMVTLAEDAVRKAMAGITSVQEVLRVTTAQEILAY